MTLRNTRNGLVGVIGREEECDRVSAAVDNAPPPEGKRDLSPIARLPVDVCGSAKGLTEPEYMVIGDNSP
jgi:hypothetical protein